MTTLENIVFIYAAIGMILGVLGVWNNRDVWAAEMIFYGDGYVIKRIMQCLIISVIAWPVFLIVVFIAWIKVRR